MAITAVTDRTQADVDARNDKGTYNAADLNRVEANTKTVAVELSAAGYFTKPTVKTNWAMEDIPDTVTMTRYLSNVQKCLDSMANGFVIPKTMDNLTYIGANQIEQALVLIEELLNNLAAVERVSNTFYSGSMDGLRGYTL